MSDRSTALVWFRHDLRLADHPALYHAAKGHDAVVPLFVWAPHEEGDWAPGGAHRWWLHRSLQALDADLRERGSRLVVREGDSLEELRAVLRHTGADAVYWNKRYAPALRERDLAVAEALRADGVPFHTLEGRLLHDPDAIQTTSGGPYHVYTPFWKKFRDVVEVPPPIEAPRLGETRAPERWPASVEVGALGLTAEAQDGVDWADGFDALWGPQAPGRAVGERGAHQRLAHFVAHGLADYDAMRDRPGRDGTSLLSPRLHHGELSPRQVWHAVEAWVENAAMRTQADAYLQEVVWREFSYHLLYHYPETTTEPLKDKFEAFRWRHAPAKLKRWQEGQTGYPIVDAAMRQLWRTGWMHNRLRMVVASFLTKDALVHWQEGARWFWDTLVDGDLGNNTMGWQWSAGCGADAQPFFRIFNPVSQGEQHDPDGTFVREWVPELAGLPDKYIHHPWDAPADVLEAAGVTLGETYPEPLVDHTEARRKALSVYNEIK